MKKRLLSAMLAVAMVATAALTGCSSGEGETSQTSGGDAAATGSQEGGQQKFDNVTLKYLNCWNGGFKNPSDTYNNEVAAAIRDKIGVTVEVEGIMMSETEKLNMEFASGDMHDIINAPFWGGDAGETQVLKKAAAEGRLLALDDSIGNYENLKDSWKVGYVTEAFLENDLEDPSFNGNHYFIPSGIAASAENITNWAYGIFARKDIVEDIGIDPTSIKTSEDLYNFLVKVRDGGYTDVNGNAIIPASTFHNGWDLSGYTLNFHPKQLTNYIQLEDGSYTYYQLTEDWVEEQLFVWRLVNENILDKECFKTTDALAEQKAGNGTVGVFSLQYGAIVNATKATGLHQNNPEMRYVPIGPLNYSTGEPLVQLEQKGAGGCGVYCFPTSCQNLEAALTWFNYLNSEEGQLLAYYGFEGDTYEMVDGQPRLMPEILERKQAGDGTVDDELRERGINLYGAPSTVLVNRVTWFGELNPGEADSADEDVEAYKEMRPIEQVEGYPIDKLAMQYPEYDTVKSFLTEGTKESDTKQQAYFAATEEEARAMLEGYQEYLRTAEGGIMDDFLKFVAEQSKTRDDVVN